MNRLHRAFLPLRSRRVRYYLPALLLSFSIATAWAEPAMWVIRTGDSITYIIGTLHLLKRQSEWKTEKVNKAVADSTDLWLEIADPENQGEATALFQKYGYDFEKSLSSRLTPEQKKKLDQIEKEYNVPAAILEPMRPWLAGLMLAIIPLQQAGFDPSAGVDRLLKEQATKEGDKIHGFETAEEQVRLLAEMPETDQISFLDYTLDDVKQGIELLDKLATAWLQGDNKTISDFFVDEVKTKAPSIYQKLIVERNVRFAAKIAELQKTPGVRMIAVGAGHLVGSDSVQAQLAKKGIKAEPY